jgi:F420-0:gamma-glutamyl ligase-like protein
MTNYKVLAVATKYWKPKEDYLQIVIDSVEGKIADGDFVVISEKAISTATGNIFDEATIEPSLNARLIARFWMRIVWGRLLGSLCRFRADMLQRLREYPAEMGSHHKEVALRHAGLLQALMFGSEGGIDGSNLPYSYVSLPLSNAKEKAREICEKLSLKLQRKACIVIADTDKTYSFKSFHFTPRPESIKGIYSFGGVFAYVIGRMLKLKSRATPIAVAGGNVAVEEALEVAEAANRARGFGAGRTVWDMAEKFEVELNEVSWEMLSTVKHKPIVIVRRKR